MTPGGSTVRDGEPTRLAAPTWQDAEAYLDAADSPTAIVPIGSTEQHGPHLPLGVDAYEAGGVAEAVSARTGVPVAPTIPSGDRPGSACVCRSGSSDSCSRSPVVGTLVARISRGAPRVTLGSGRDVSGGPGRTN